MSRDEWIDAACAELMRMQPMEPEDVLSEYLGSMRSWAECLADEPNNYFGGGYTPHDAVMEELSYA